MPQAALHTSYPSTTDAVPDAVAAVQAFGEGHQIAEAVLDRMLLAVAEAVANGVEHGNAHDAGKQVDVRLDRDGAAWVLRVRDEGVGLAEDALDHVSLPEDLLDTGGRGLFIIQQLADAMWLEEEGRCVCLRFDGKPDASSGSDSTSAASNG